MGLTQLSPDDCFMMCYLVLAGCQFEIFGTHILFEPDFRKDAKNDYFLWDDGGRLTGFSMIC